MWENHKIGENGVYVIGKLYEIKSGGARLPSSCYHYYFRDKEYTFIVADAGQGDSLRFLKILKENPKTCRPIDQKVPYCLTIDQVPDKGWEKLPVDTCQ